MTRKCDIIYFILDKHWSKLRLYLHNFQSEIQFSRVEVFLSLRKKIACDNLIGRFQNNTQNM